MHTVMVIGGGLVLPALFVQVERATCLEGLEPRLVRAHQANDCGTRWQGRELMPISISIRGCGKYARNPHHMISKK